jgi:phosphoribosylformylglycinamidine synthase
MVINGKEQPGSLIDMIMNTQNFTNPNNVIKFSDNSRYSWLIKYLVCN